MITLVFGSVGSGKSSYAQWYVNKLTRKGVPVFANCEYHNAQVFDILTFGNVSFPRGSVIIIDEAGICFNNRNYKKFNHSLIEYLKLHRHFGIKEIVFISQDFEDVDITIRRLASNLLYCMRLGTFGIYKPCRKFVLINKETSQIEYGYQFKSILNWRVLNLPKYWHLYDSYDEDKRLLVRSFEFKSIKKRTRKQIILSCLPYAFLLLICLLIIVL